MAFGLNVTYQMKPGKGAEFLRAIREAGLLETIRGEQGCLGYEYFTSAEDADKVLLVECWTGRYAQQTHLKQPHMDRLRAIKDACALDTRVEGYEL